MERKTSPVFVVGCHRSGTNLLYDTLLSAGGFAVYRGYLPIYKMLIPRFGKIERPSNRRRIVEAWLGSKAFYRSGLERNELEARMLSDCRTGGDFLRIIMDSIARKQCVSRWAVYDADNVLHMERIKADIPEALFVHIVRDGRDIALSLKKMGGFRPLPWRRKPGSLATTALYWEWMAHKGRESGGRFPADYYEIHYEDLVSHPQQTLAELGRFLQHSLDYRHIQRAALGSLSESNSSFRHEPLSTGSNPVNRWRERLSRDEIVLLECLIGETLCDFGYELSMRNHESPLNLRANWEKRVFPGFLDAKLWLKINSPLGRLSSLATLEIDHQLSQMDA